jgi:hypothetical protein
LHSLRASDDLLVLRFSRFHPFCAYVQCFTVNLVSPVLQSPLLREKNLTFYIVRAMSSSVKPLHCLDFVSVQAKGTKASTNKTLIRSDRLGTEAN